MSSRKSGRSVSSVPGSDRLTRSKVKKGSQPHPSIGAIFRPAAASSAAAGPSEQSNVQDGEQSVTVNPTESQASGARGSTNIHEGVPPLPEYHGPTLSQAENSSQEREAVNRLLAERTREYVTQADQQPQVGRQQSENPSSAKELVARGAEGRVESIVPQSMGIGASSARPPLAASSPTGAVVARQTQGVCVPVTAQRQVNPQLPIGVFTSSSSSPSSGEQAQMLQQAYGIPSVTDCGQQQLTGLTNYQTNVNPPQSQAIATQEARLPEQNVMVQGQASSTTTRGPVVQSPTATAFQQPAVQRRIEAPATAQINQEASAGSIPQSTVYVTRRLPGIGWRTARQPIPSQGNLTQGVMQGQQVQSLGTSNISAEQTAMNRNVVEICRNEDQRVQERLANRIEQAVLQLTNDLKTQSERSNAVEQRLNQVLTTLGQTTTEEMPSVLRNLRQLRGDVNALMEGSSQSKRTIVPADSNQVTGVGGPTSTRKDNVQGKSYSIDNIEDPNAYSVDNLRADIRRHCRQEKHGHRGRRKHKRYPCGRKDKKCFAYDEESSDSSDSDKSDSSSDEEDYRGRARSASNFYRRGPKFRNLKELRPNNPCFTEALSYRTYRLEDTSQARSGRQTGKIRDHIKRLKLALGDAAFDGEDPILILEFLARFMEEANNNQMSEAQAFVALPYFLRKDAATQFRSVRASSYTNAGGISSWPEAVQYLLRTYATPSAIRDAIRQFRSCVQKNDESERSFALRLAKAGTRCGNVFEEWEKISIFIDGLHPTTRALVARHRENAGADLTFEQIVHYAQDQGDSVRALRGEFAPKKKTDVNLEKNASTSRAGVRPRHRGGSAMLVESSEEFRDERSTDPSTYRQPNADLLLLGAGTSDNTSDLPSGSYDTVTGTALTTQSEFEDPLLVARHVPAPYVPHQEGYPYMEMSRPGWTNRGQGRPMRTNNNVKKIVICWKCYKPGHVAPDCDLTAEELQSVIDNYHALTPAERATVPPQSYERVRMLLGQMNLTGHRGQMQQTAVNNSVVMNKATSNSVAENPPRVLTKNNVINESHKEEEESKN